MKWPFLTLLSVAVLLSSCAATPLPPNPHLKVIENTKHSVVRLLHEQENGQYEVCTGFLVDSIHLVTAAHCIMEGITAHDIPVRLIKNNEAFALYELPAPIGVPMQIRSAPLTVGEEVIALGYGLGIMQVFTRHVADPKHNGDVLLDGLLVRGMSGGPVVDLDGKVIGLIQMAQEGTIAILCGQDELIAFLKK